MVLSGFTEAEMSVIIASIMFTTLTTKYLVKVKLFDECKL